MERDLKGISANNKLEYYTSGKVIRDTDMVDATIKYFESGPGSRAFESLQFLNLLWFQLLFIDENIADTNKLIDTLNDLQLSDLEKHILFGFILKWSGGYPLEAPAGYKGSELYYNFRKKLLEIFWLTKMKLQKKIFAKLMLPSENSQ